jgi:hypothetical protein
VEKVGLEGLVVVLRVGLVVMGFPEVEVEGLLVFMEGLVVVIGLPVVGG